MFIDLTEGSAPKTPTRAVIQQEDDVHASRSSLQASRFYYHPLLHQSQPNKIDIDKKIDITLNRNRRVYPLRKTTTIPTRSSVVSTPRKDLLKSPTPQSKLSLYATLRNVDEVQVMNNILIKSKGQSTVKRPTSSRSLEVNGFVELPMSRLNINENSPSAKRRCTNVKRSPIPASKMSDTAQSQYDGDLRLAEEEDNIIDLTISDNFPVSQPNKSSLKRGTLDPFDISDDDGKGADGRTSNPITSTKTPASLQEAKARNRLAAPGIKRRLAALGRHIPATPPSIIDLSADTDSDEEEPELLCDALTRPSIIGPEDYLSDDEISRQLANLSIGPERMITERQKSTHSRTEVDVFSNGNLKIKAGKSVELKDGNFLRILSVLKDEQGDVFLSGHLLSRQNSCGRLMPRLRNELVWIVEISREDFEAGLLSIPSEVRVTEVVRIRSVTFTNQRYPEMSMKTYKDGGFTSVRDEITTGPLFCRWKSTKVGDRKQKHEDSLIHLSFAEADPKPEARVQAGAVRDMWRSQTVLGGSHFATRNSNINLVSQRSNSTSEQIQQYTFGDAFCGAGGCSTGASQAGLRVNWGFDKDKDTIRVYAANLGQREGVECLMEAVDEFCGRSDSDRFMADILHMSPPCQPFSPAHTVPSEVQDEINQAALFSVWHLLENIKPRIATIEETEGLVNRHIDWFHALINIFICNGYSVRWKIVRCQDYGVPQQRRRLFIIAAG